MKPELKITSDGSRTLFVPELNEHYHSTYGAVQESMHVFINAGLNSMTKSEIRIFEMGFGTGLNALLTFLYGQNFNKINYHSVELYPIDIDLALNMNFSDFLKLTHSQTEIFHKMHDSAWNEEVEISTSFILKKIKDSLQNIDLNGGYDLVYYDAFAPAVQPDLWTIDIFKKLYHSMNQDAVLVTYCAKGDVRRAMLQCGFHVEKLPGPPGKIHILRAIKIKLN